MGDVIDAFIAVAALAALVVLPRVLARRAMQRTSVLRPPNVIDFTKARELFRAHTKEGKEKR